MTAVPPGTVITEEVVALARGLIRIPSQYIDNELVQHGDIADFLAAHMASIGLEVGTLEDVRSYPVVVGTTPGGGTELVPRRSLRRVLCQRQLRGPRDERRLVAVGAADAAARELNVRLRPRAR